MMFSFVDNFLNKITMYRLVLYVLFSLVFLGILLSLFNILPHNPLYIFLSFILLNLVCYFTNEIFSKIFRAPTNVESVYITASILALVASPLQNLTDISQYVFLISVSAIAMASKYILAIRKKHIFNPAAVALVITAFLFGQGASWWVGVPAMFPFVLVGGFLIIKKIQRFDIFLVFLGITALGSFSNFFSVLYASPLLFFSTVMLTEPLTSPPQKWARVLYGALVGVLSFPTLHIGGIYSTPEIALVLSNIFAYLVSPKQKLVLALKERVLIAKDTYDFIFSSSEKLRFKAGQYLEWTIPHKNPDTRGNRRYFTIASSPTENNIRLGIKFYPNGSTFKQKMLALVPGEKLSAGALAGEFTLPREKNTKLVFLAGGIGITPFRSMLKELIDKKEKRDIIIFYSVRSRDDLAYAEIIEAAQTILGVKSINIFTDHAGLLTKEALVAQTPDYKQRCFYISGTRSMVVAFESILKELGIPKRKIKTDFFPGYV